MEKENLTAVEWLYDQIKNGFNYNRLEVNGYENQRDRIFKQAKEMEKEQRGYNESDMRSYASYILNNPVIEPSEWYKIYRTK